MKPLIRKEVVIIDELRSEMGKILDVPLRKCAAIAIVENIFANKAVKDLSLYGEYGVYLGKLLVDNALEALGIAPEAVQSYGKAALTGVNGELEHGSALLHIAFDGSVREVLKDTKSIFPSNEKVGATGRTLDCPLHSKVAVKVRNYYDTMEICVEDAPRPNEIMIALCVTTGSRPLPRVGGLQLSEVIGLDGVN